MLFLAVLASGNGSNLTAIRSAIVKKQLDAEIKLVLSNNSQSGALQFARDQKIPAIHLSTKTTIDEFDFQNKMQECFSQHQVNFIALAGYMKMLPVGIIRNYRNRITNIHPALLPEFGGKGMYGMHVHEAIIKSRAKISGATVHIVDELFDHGPIVLQRSVAVDENDSPETLAKKVLQIEHQIYPEALQLFSENRIIIQDNRVLISSKRK